LFGVPTGLVEAVSLAIVSAAAGAVVSGAGVAVSVVVSAGFSSELPHAVTKKLAITTVANMAVLKDFKGRSCMV
jgi:hypothetical protein